jgi:hypothetical protein
VPNLIGSLEISGCTFELLDALLRGGGDARAPCGIDLRTIFTARSRCSTGQRFDAICILLNEGAASNSERFTR